MMKYMIKMRYWFYVFALINPVDNFRKIDYQKDLDLGTSGVILFVSLRLCVLGLLTPGLGNNQCYLVYLFILTTQLPPLTWPASAGTRQQLDPSKLSLNPGQFSPCKARGLQITDGLAKFLVI